MPKAIGCGRSHINGRYPLNLCLGTGGRLPGRPPYNITCVRAKGVSSIEQRTGSGADCDSYDLFINVRIPIEIILRDCCGYLYILRSELCGNSGPNDIAPGAEQRGIGVRIPLCSRVGLLGDSMLYVKTRVRLCETEGPITTDNPATSCTSGSAVMVTLDVTVEACVMRLVPYGLMGPDPYSSTMPWFPQDNYSFCGYNTATRPGASASMGNRCGPPPADGSGVHAGVC